jgi:hypothetical protein
MEILLPVLLAVAWCMSGIVPAHLCWQAVFKEEAPTFLLIFSMITGPLGGLGNICCYFTYRR